MNNFKNNVKQVLEAAKSKIDKHQKWTKDYYAKSSQGKHVLPTDPEAARFCAIGAIHAVCPNAELRHAAIKALKLQLTIPSLSIICFNDLPSTTHKDVIEIFNKAINDISK